MGCGCQRCSREKGFEDVLPVKTPRIPSHKMRANFRVALSHPSSPLMYTTVQKRGRDDNYSDSVVRMQRVVTMTNMWCSMDPTSSFWPSARCSGCHAGTQYTILTGFLHFKNLSLFSELLTHLLPLTLLTKCLLLTDSCVFWSDGQNRRCWRS